MTKLLQCPFCGSDAKFTCLQEGPNMGGQFVECTNENCNVSSRMVFPSKVDPKLILVEWWNNRVSIRSIPPHYKDKQPVILEDEFILRTLACFVEDLKTSKSSAECIDKQACILTAYMRKVESACVQDFVPRAELEKAISIPRQHEITGPHPECGCASCQTHRRYQDFLSPDKARALQECIEWLVSHTNVCYPKEQSRRVKEALSTFKDA